MAPAEDREGPPQGGKSGNGAAFVLLGLGIVIVLAGAVGLEIALSHQRGPSAARAANRATAASPSLSPDAGSLTPRPAASH